MYIIINLKEHIWYSFRFFCNEKVRIKKVKDKGDVYVGCDEKNT